MPTLDEMLNQTPFGLADKSAYKKKLGNTDSVTAADPGLPTIPIPFPYFNPNDPDGILPHQTVLRNADGWVLVPTAEQRRTIAVWCWEHDGATPNTVKNIQTRVLGMGMDYRMAMSVCTEMTLQEVTVTLPNGTVCPPLPFDSSFVIRKYKWEGHVSAGASKMFPLEMNVDQSLLVVFGYRFTAGKWVALTEEDANKADFMPSPVAGGNIPCKVGDIQPCVIKDYRIIVCFSFTCCKENNTLEPGAVLGANKVYPTVMIMPNLPLKEIQAMIKIVRPQKSNHHSPDMHPEIGQILFTDTNFPTAQVVGPRLPFWDNMFDYYETDPAVNIHGPLRVVDSLPGSARGQQRTKKGVLTKLGDSSTPPYDESNPPRNPVIRATYEDKDLLKVARQGDFDNMHIAPRMRLPASATLTADVIAQWRLDPIAMAPFCVHDCLHTHVRWGVAASYFWSGGVGIPTPAFVKGFDNNYTPYCVEAAPQVPHNQSVTWVLLPPAGFTYRGTIHFDISPGTWQVVYHHGLGYANELWGEATVRQDMAIGQARVAVDAYASYQMEQQFPPLSAAASWAFFYWRLRFGGTAWYGDLTAPKERVVSKVSDCMSF